MKTRIKILMLAGTLGVALLAGSVLLLGCGGRTTVHSNPSASVGQQLQDLDKAYKDGVITEKEYEKLKKSLIKKND